MKKINIISDAVYANDGGGEIAGREEIGNLNAGALVMFDEDGVTVADGTVIAPTDLSAVVSMHVGIQPSLNFTIKPASMTKQTYIAPVDKIDYIGNIGSGVLDVDLTTPFLDGDSIGIMVRPSELEEGDVIRKSYHIVLLSSDTIDTALDALVAKINADPNRMVDALKITTTTYRGVKLTGKGRNFGYSLLGLWQFTTITNSVAYKVGFGTQALIQTMVDDNSAMVGDRDGLDGRKIFTPVVVPASATGFVVYTLNHFHIRDYPVMLGSNPMMKQHVFIVPTTLTDIIEDLDAFAVSINA